MVISKIFYTTALKWKIWDSPLTEPINRSSTDPIPELLQKEEKSAISLAKSF